MIGEPGNNATHIYRDDGTDWQLEQSIFPDDLANASNFGIAVAIDGPTAVIGASARDCAAGTDCGVAYVYRFDGSLWNAEATLVAPDAAPDDRFGGAVSVLGDLALIGNSCQFSCGGSGAYLFRHDLGVWAVVEKVQAASTGFGSSVAVRTDQLLVGAYAAGIVFVYSLAATAPDCDCDSTSNACEIVREGAPDCNGNSVQDDCDVADGTSPDCNANGTPDECDVARETSPDCNANSTPDECDVAEGSSPDCNANSTPDECDVADGTSTDANDNDVPDECDTHTPPFVIEHPEDVTACGPETVVFKVKGGGMQPLSYQWRKDTVDLAGEEADTLALSGVSQADAGDYDVVVTNDLGSTISDPATLSFAVLGDVAPEPTVVPKNRYLSFIAPPTPCRAAIRVRLLSLQHPNPPNVDCCPPPDFSGYEEGPTCTDPAGCVRWVGEPRRYLEVQELPGYGTFQAARLQCTPYYRDWSDVGYFSVTGAEIVPSSVYEVEMLAASCQGIEETCAEVSAPLEIATARWGDIAERRNPPFTGSQPDAIDIVWLINKFKAAPGALSNTVVQLRPNVPDINSDPNALDVASCVDAFKSRAYPFSGPCPCPSDVPCETTACATSASCIGAYGAGALCVRTCAPGSPREGEICTQNKHCGACLGGTNAGATCNPNSCWQGNCCPGGGTCAPGTCGAQGYCRDRCGRCAP